MLRQIAEGTSLDALGTHDASFQEGERGILELHLLWTPPGIDTLLSSLDWTLRKAGVTLYRDSEALSGGRVRIYFQRAFPPLAIIAIALIGAWLLMVASWKLFKEEAWDAALLLVVIGIIVLAVVVFRRTT